MQPLTSLIVFTALLVSLILGGCMMSVGPLPHTPYANADGSAAKSPPPATEIVETDRAQRHWHREGCDQPPQIKDKRPIIPAFTDDEAKDPTAVNRKLIVYIKKLDTYIANHQQKEDDAYQRWKDNCHLP